MIVCPNCSRSNENHYKFCLGCGTELSKADVEKAPPVAIVLPTALPEASAAIAETSDSILQVDKPIASTRELSTPPGVIPAVSKPTLLDQTRTIDQIVETNPPNPVPESMNPGPTLITAAPKSSPVLPFESPIISGSAALGEASWPFQKSAASRIDEPERPLAGESTLSQASQYSAALSQELDGRQCSSCAAVVPEGFKFCGVCGTRYEEPQSVVEAPRVGVELVLIHPDGSEGQHISLTGDEVRIGRESVHEIFAQDPFLSPQHATFAFQKGLLYVQDNGSLNGIFLRIKAEVELFHGDMFRIGQQLLRFEEMSQLRPTRPGAGDGTIVMGSPTRGTWGRLALAVGIDSFASVWTLNRPEVALGRERGDIVFSEDGFVSGLHAKMVTRDGRYFLSDVGSTNGTYLRIKGEGLLAAGDLMLLGQQLFRVDLHGG